MWCSLRSPTKQMWIFLVSQVKIGDFGLAKVMPARPGKRFE